MAQKKGTLSSANVAFSGAESFEDETLSCECEALLFCIRCEDALFKKGFNLTDLPLFYDTTIRHFQMGQVMTRIFNF